MPKEWEETKAQSVASSIPNRIDIEQRPVVVNEKSRLGDWEADTGIGKGHQGVFVTFTSLGSVD